MATVKYVGADALRENIVKTKEWVQSQDYITYDDAENGNLGVNISSPFVSYGTFRSSMITTGGDGLGQVSLGLTAGQFPIFLGVVIEGSTLDGASTTPTTVTGRLALVGNTWYACLQALDSTGSGVSDVDGYIDYMKMNRSPAASLYDDR